MKPEELTYNETQDIREGACEACKGNLYGRWEGCHTHCDRWADAVKEYCKTGEVTV